MAMEVSEVESVCARRTAGPIAIVAKTTEIVKPFLIRMNVPAQR
jgi:hypothetical protein